MPVNAFGFDRPGLRRYLVIRRELKYTWWAICRPYGRLRFAVRNPRLWWFCRRMDLHYWFGLPFPEKYWEFELDA